MNRIRDLREDMDLRQVDVPRRLESIRKPYPIMKQVRHSRMPERWLRWQIFFM